MLTAERQEMQQSKQSNNLVVKVIVILVVFPVSYSVCSILFGFPLSLLFGFLFPVTDAIEWILRIMSVAAGIVGAIWISRLAWPRKKETKCEP